MKRISATLLALCLLCGTALADSGGRPSLSCRRQGEDIRLTLENLENQVCALQLTLALEGDCPDVRFVPEAEDAYAPDCHVEAAAARRWRPFTWWRRSAPFRAEGCPWGP